MGEFSRINARSARPNRTAAPIFFTPPVDTFQHHRQLRRGQANRAVFRLGPDEAAFFQSLGEEAQALAVPVQHFDQIAAAAAEHEQLTAERIFAQVVLRQRREAAEAFALMCCST